MVYKAHYRTFPGYVFLLISLIMFTLQIYYIEMPSTHIAFVWLYGFLSLLCLSLLCLRFEVNINKETIALTIRLYHLKVYHAAVTPEKIKMIHIKDSGVNKSVFITRESGFTWRLIRFLPQGMELEIERFALNHQIGDFGQRKGSS
ncbi:hypothetical protein [Alkalihalobacillus sp. 1P02AB]|uniref:hypothetical protein n=1 Tax=Alkalihalobacillus sp. 1P02AB TaxID=3132260 RepID=UPI0039A5B7AA